MEKTHAALPPLYLERREPRRNIARFYALDIEEDLFGQTLAIRRWGRIGTTGRRREQVCADIAEALSNLREKERQKRRRGYRDGN